MSEEFDIKQLESDLKQFALDQDRLAELKAKEAEIIRIAKDSYPEVFEEMAELSGKLKGALDDLRQRAEAAAALGAKFTKDTHGIEIQTETVIEILDDRAAIRWLMDNDLDQFVDIDPKTGQPKINKKTKEPEIVKLVTLYYPARLIAKIRPFALVGALPWAQAHFNVPQANFDTNPLDFRNKWERDPEIRLTGKKIAPNPEGETAKESRRRETHAGSDMDHTLGAGLEPEELIEE